MIKATLNFSEIKIAQKLEISYMKLQMNMERSILDSKMHTVHPDPNTVQKKKFKPFFTRVKYS